MSRYRHAIDQVKSHLRSLWVVILLQVVIIAGLCVAMIRMPENLVVHIPPDLRAGATLAYREIPPETVYIFSFYILQQLNRWPDNGAEDYGAAIYRTDAFLTATFRQFLIDDMNAKAQIGELRGRVRSVQALPGQAYSRERVRIDNHDQWTVTLDVELLESVQGMTVKHTRIRYPVRVLRHAIDPEANPWGLALAGFDSPGPQRLAEDGTTSNTAIAQKESS